MKLHHKERQYSKGSSNTLPTAVKCTHAYTHTVAQQQVMTPVPRRTKCLACLGQSLTLQMPGLVAAAVLTSQR